MRLDATASQMLQGMVSLAPNASKFDRYLPGDLSVFQFSLFNPGIALESNTSEIYHSGIKVNMPHVYIGRWPVGDADAPALPASVFSVRSWMTP